MEAEYHLNLENYLREIPMYFEKEINNAWKKQIWFSAGQIFNLTKPI